MADRASFSDRLAQGVSEAVADIRSALVERAWFGYEELSRAQNSHFYGAPYIDRSVEGSTPPELIEAEWSRGNRTGDEWPGPSRRTPDDLAREFGEQRERQHGRDDPGIDFDR